MAQYTTLNTSEIKSICKEFNIGDIISYKVLSGGSENTNYHIISEEKQFVLTICEQKSFKESKDLADLLVHLQKHGFKTSKIVINKNNESISKWKSKPMMIKEYLDGNIVKDLSPVLLELIGRELGKLHQVDPPGYLPTQLNYGMENFHIVKEYDPNSEFDQWLNQVAQYISPYFQLNLPKTLIHSDLFWDNVIISHDGQSATIMDMEEAAHYYRVYDIGMAIIGLCGESDQVNLEKAKSLLKGYQEEIQLLDIEKEALKAFTVYAGASMTFWRHINFNYTKPTPAKYNHYLGLKVLTDFIWEQADDCFTGLL